MKWTGYATQRTNERETGFFLGGRGVISDFKESNVFTMLYRIHKMHFGASDTFLERTKCTRFLKYFEWAYLLSNGIPSQLIAPILLGK